MIQQLSKEYPLQQLCEVLEVARSGYYRWLKGEPTARQKANGQLMQQILRVFQAKRGTYGSLRMTHELRRQGHQCNHKRVERLMRLHGLKGRTAKKRKVRTTLSDHGQPIVPNLLRDRPAPSTEMTCWDSKYAFRSPQAEYMWPRLALESGRSGPLVNTTMSKRRGA